LSPNRFAGGLEGKHRFPGGIDRCVTRRGNGLDLEAIAKSHNQEAVIKGGVRRFLVSRFERTKYMSTKTSFKRIALVAASALAIAGFSAVPAHALATVWATVAGTSTVSGSFNAGDTVTATIKLTPSAVSIAGDSINAKVTVSGPGAAPVVTGATAAITGVTSNAASATAGGLTFLDGGTTHLVAGVNTLGTVTFPAAAAGTYVITVTPTAVVGGGTITATTGSTTTSVVVGTYASAVAVGLATESPTGTALSASNYTKNPVRNANQVSAISVTAGKTVSLSLIAISGSLTANFSTTKVSMRSATTSYGNVVASAANTDTADGAANLLTAFTAPSVPGTYYLDVTTAPGGTYAAATDLTTTVTMTVTAASGYSSGTSSAFANDLSAAGTSDTDGTMSGIKTVDTEAGVITVTAKNADGTACTACTIGGYIIGQGKISIGTDTTAGASLTAAQAAAKVRSLTAIAQNGTYNAATVVVWSDGTAGTGVVHITVTDAAGTETELATKDVVFYGSAAKLEVTSQSYKILAAGGATSGIKTALVSAATTTLATSPAFVVKVTDSAGNAVGGLNGSLAGVSSDTSVVGAVSSNEDVVTTIDPNSTWGGPGYYVFDATSANTATSGKSATVTIRMVDPADSTKYLTTTVNFTIGGSVAKEVISTDKTSYAAGEQMLVTITATDKSGNPVADGTASPALSFNKQVGGSYGASVYVGGKRTNSANTLFAPSIGGDLTLFLCSHQRVHQPQ
jgi:hypothetical protein